MTTYDAIVVGGGHNGLAAAAYLARAGWRTLVLERNARVGGAVMSGEITAPGAVHDLYSTNQSVFLTSPVYRELRDDLERHGLRYRTSDHPYCNVFPDGRFLGAYRDADRTREAVRANDPRDVDGWDQLRAHFQRFEKSLLPLLQAPVPSLAAGGVVGRAAAAVGPAELGELAQILASSTREVGDAFFHSREMRAAFATWGLHLDFGPDVSGGALFPFNETFGGVEHGMAITEGGASHMPEALAAIVREHGGDVRTNAPVRRVVVEGGRAVGVELEDGTRVDAERAVVANLTPAVLYGQRGGRGLVPNAVLPEEFRRKVDGFRYGPGTMMVHLLLRGRPRWAAGPEVGAFAYVHVAPYVEDLAQTYLDAEDGRLPASPLLIVGQTTAVDPSRVDRARLPDGEILWIQVRTLPREIRGDALDGRPGAIAARTWAEAAEPFAERVLDKLEAYAPGVREQIVGRAVYSPADLARHNPNLVGGDSISGSHHIRQQLAFRPFPGWSRYETPVEGLYEVGASTWPGAGTNATSGYLCAQALLGAARRRGVARGALAVGAAAGAVAGVAALARALGGDGAGTDGGSGTAR